MASQVLHERRNKLERAPNSNYFLTGACFAEAIAKKLKSASIWKQKPTESHFYLTQVRIYKQFVIL